MLCQRWTTRVGSSPISQGSSSCTAVWQVRARPSRRGSPRPTIPSSVVILRKSQRGLTRNVSIFLIRSCLGKNRPSCSEGVVRGFASGSLIGRTHYTPCSSGVRKAALCALFFRRADEEGIRPGHSPPLVFHLDAGIAFRPGEGKDGPGEEAPLGHALGVVAGAMPGAVRA